MPRIKVGTGKGWGAAKGKKTLISEPSFKENWPAGIGRMAYSNPRKKQSMKGKKKMGSPKKQAQYPKKRSNKMSY